MSLQSTTLQRTMTSFTLKSSGVLSTKK